MIWAVAIVICIGNNFKAGIENYVCCLPLENGEGWENLRVEWWTCDGVVYHD
jgi:hypothetical protein